MVGRVFFADSHDEYNTHPIFDLIRNANKQWEEYEHDRSTTFRETVSKYRKRYGRHPPPGFADWYKFARDRKVHHIDDFQQIIDDLRPFWGIEPWLIRQMAASLSDHGNGMGGIHIRNKTVAKISQPSWRVEALAAVVSRIVEYLPDMDIAVNIHDQPRLVVPFEDIQQYLHVEQNSRHTNATSTDHFTADMDHLQNLTHAQEVWDEEKEAQWFWPEKHRLMGVAKAACPPESPARDSNMTDEDADRLYKTPVGGFVSNFNLSTDLCTVGPALENLHGLLFAPASIILSQKLLPVFGECKVSVNNEILFPANMYTMKDPRYEYNPSSDVEWERKADTLLWRGATSGGISREEDWRDLHRQRLVLLANGTLDHNGQVSVLAENAQHVYEPTRDFNSSNFAQNHFDVGFTEIWACEPDCSMYDRVIGVKAPIPLSEQFKAKYLIDVDGHSFSGRWRAFHFSRSLGLKATIFREWHDSRLFPWRHFVPLDNRYDDLYSLMTYFIGTGHRSEESSQPEPHVPGHDFEAKKIASQSRDWANQVLRDEDIDIYMLRLLLEYGRIIDDNRDSIGYSGNGSELDKYDRESFHTFSRGGGWSY
ncbi:uncharacterized protein BDW43DRAFT_175719 [Aspergillus alliaceus]|uniref:uncharacterized protein n=1 Tax=Petromyces alliaceus TaxID=209559 RepID=UPI0012A5F954|nr:uncharacterized protein BDW43DRAFT_175719 [Aspergillus alliaceus]KAB8229904.1 hypothetical protein BDW43DRAFT_175719 [Aspergillus alliaceus]